MRIGFIGLGFQGLPLARNIADDKHHLTVFDVRAEAMDEIAAAGARKGLNPADVARQSDLVIVCVVDDAQVMQVLQGPEGILDGARAGLIVAVHSTILPETIRAASAACDAVGARLVDAPVSGSAQGARDRTMSYMVGGEDEAVEACLPVFRISGPTVTRTGAVGTATATKIAHQLVCCVNMLAVHEGLKLGEAAGVPRDVLLQAFSAGFAQSRAADMWPGLDLYPRAYPIFFKDLKAVLDLAHDVGVTVPGAALTQQALAELLPRFKKDAAS